MNYAEVIGDPIAHSRSPIIHGFWLEQLGLPGHYERTHVTPDDLPSFIEKRRADPDWRGCNVTIPHKVAIIPLLDAIDPAAASIGAVNCVTPRDGTLTGTNTDVDGVRAAIAGLDLKGRKAVIIGAGGGARAAVACLAEAGAEIHILARDPVRAATLSQVSLGLTVSPLDAPEAVIRDAALIVNASSMGMSGADEMPPALIAALAHAPGATAFDMVYQPRETAFLHAAGAIGLKPVGGLVMLIGQARRAFTAFFGAEPPADGDETLIARLTA